MDSEDRSADFVPAGLAAVGIEADEVEMQVIEGVHQLFWPPIAELLAMDLGEAPPEARANLSEPPR